MSTPVGVIKKFVKTLIETNKTINDADKAVNAAFKAVGASSYDSFQEKFSSAQSNLSAEEFLEQYCGINVNNNDTGAITGLDASGSKTKTAESIVPETATAKELTKAEYNSFTKNGLTVNVTYLKKSDDEVGEEYGDSAKTYLAKQKLVVRALYNWWIPESLDLINESLGLNFTDGRASINEINIVFDDDYGNNKCATSLDFIYDKGLASEVTLTINSNILYNMTANDKNGTFDEDKAIWSIDFYENNASRQFSNYLDRVVLQSLAEVALKSNIAYAYYLPQEITNGLCEIVGGFDSTDVDLASYTEYGGRWWSDDLSNYGYGLIRYLAKNYSDGNPDGISYNKKKTVLTVTTDYEETSPDLADFESTVKNVDASALKTGIKITGNAKDNSIVGGSGNDYLLGGKGADTLNGGKGNDTLKGGAGNDIFIYTAGKDVISDYAEGDKISLGAAITNTTVDGSDVVFTIGKGTLTIKDAQDKTLTLINSKGKESTTVISGAKTLNVTNKTSSPLTIDSDIKTVDASKRTKAIKIYGNKLDNVILGGSKSDILYGQGGNDSILGNAGDDVLYGGFGDDTLKGGKGSDTLIGGAGNDSLWGDAGADTFVYSSGGGKDVIFDFDDKDTLTLDSLDFTASHKSGVVTLKFEEGSVTLKDFTATTFHINDDTYKISGSKFRKQ